VPVSLSDALSCQQNFPLPSVRLLRHAGHDELSITEEAPGISDDRILACAVAEERIILTFDRDYGKLIYRIGMVAAAVLLLHYEPHTPQESAHQRKAFGGDGMNGLGPKALNERLPLLFCRYSADKLPIFRR